VGVSECGGEEGVEEDEEEHGHVEPGRLDEALEEGGRASLLAAAVDLLNYRVSKISIILTRYINSTQCYLNKI